MAELGERNERRRRIFEEIGAFLFEHRLEPSPANYLLVHQMITRSNASAVAAIEEATSDGLRLSQRDADRIMNELGSTMAGGESSAPALTHEVIDEARRQMESFAAIVESTRQEVETYERDLESGAAGLAKSGDLDSIADLIRLTSTMIERTRSAERRLESATSEARALRERLASAEEEARRDPLTGLPNRRAFQDRYAALLEADMPVTIALCDVDRFKSVNDSHGHAVGDRVLKMVGQLLETHCEGHMVTRYGGEEFVIHFPGLDVETAAAIVEGAREAVSDRRFKVRETDEPLDRITFSAGIVAARRGEDEESLLRRADALLYEAKNGGRNRVQSQPVAAPGAHAVGA
jgi:diguanylate cyclase